MNFIKTRSTTTSGTITLPDTDQHVMCVHDAGVTAAKTFELPADPFDGQVVMFSFNTAIVALTISAPVGTIQDPIAGVAALATKSYIYDTVSNKWYNYI